MALKEKLRNEVDEKVLLLTPTQLVEIAKNLQIRATRLNKSHLSLLCNVNDAIDKHCDEKSEEEAQLILKELLQKLNTLLDIRDETALSDSEKAASGDEIEEVGTGKDNKENEEAYISADEGEKTDSEEKDESKDEEDTENAVKNSGGGTKDDKVVVEEEESTETVDQTHFLVEKETPKDTVVDSEEKQLEEELGQLQLKLQKLKAKKKSEVTTSEVVEVKQKEKDSKNLNERKSNTTKEDKTNQSNKKEGKGTKIKKDDKNGNRDKENKKPQQKTDSNRMSEDLEKLRQMEEDIRKKYKVDLKESLILETETKSKLEHDSIPLRTRETVPSLRNVELRSLKACWRPPLKFKGQIGGTTGKDMDFISLKRQIRAAKNKDPPYEDSDIVQAVIDSVTAGTKLRRLLETSEDMTLDELLEELKPVLQDSTGKDLLRDLQTLRQESASTAQDFVMDGCELKNRIVKEKIVNEEVAQEILLETLETGFASESVRNYMRPYLHGDISRSELLTATKRAMRADVERKTKFGGKSVARVNELETDSCLRNGPNHLFQKQQQLLEKQMDELLDIRADMAKLEGSEKQQQQQQPKQLRQCGHTCLRVHKIKENHLWVSNMQSSRKR